MCVSQGPVIVRVHDEVMVGDRGGCCSATKRSTIHIDLVELTLRSNCNLLPNKLSRFYRATQPCKRGLESRNSVRLLHIGQVFYHFGGDSPIDGRILGVNMRGGRFLGPKQPLNREKQCVFVQ